MEPSEWERFEALFQEFVPAYAEAPAGKKHRNWYARGRKDGRDGYETVLRAADKGEDVTDLVLRRLLPHADTTFNRDRKAWVTWAPAVTKDVKSWFENSPTLKTKAADWPTIAKSLFNFVRRCNERPGELRDACAQLVAVPQMKGFQTGLLSPILNALRPDDFFVINNKSRPAINFFAGCNFSHELDYRPMHALCAFIIDQAGPQHAQGERAMLPFVVNMNRLFEQFVSTVLAQEAGPDRSVLAQQRIQPAGDAVAFVLDLLVRDRHGKALRVVDTKYKNVTVPGSDDVAQVVAYATAVGATEAVLVYPRTVNWTAFVGPVRVRMMGLPLDGDLCEAAKALATRLVPAAN